MEWDYSGRKGRIKEENRSSESEKQKEKIKKQKMRK